MGVFSEDGLIAAVVVLRGMCAVAQVLGMREDCRVEEEEKWDGLEFHVCRHLPERRGCVSEYE